MKRTIPLVISLGLVGACGGMGHKTSEGLRAPATPRPFQNANQQTRAPTPAAPPVKGHEAPAPNVVEETRQDRFSTFAVDVDTASYSIARRTLENDRTPHVSTVRVEEFVNAFRYDYEPPEQGEGLFSITADGARHPQAEELHLLRVGLAARDVTVWSRKPTNLVFLIDTSCSMTSSDKLPLVKRSLQIAVSQLRRGDKVAITTYAGSVTLVLPPTDAKDKGTIRDAIRNLRNGGGTAMADGMMLAYSQAAKMMEDGSITRVIVCSDGDANIGASGPAAILGQIRHQVKKGITMSTIGYGTGNYRDDMMERLANDGNGNYYYVDGMDEAEKVFGRDFNQMVQDVAQDVKVQVEFNTDLVQSYRLVGYENRDIADEDFRKDEVDAGEIGAGHQVTALYELKLNPQGRGNIGVARVRAKRPGGEVAKEREVTLTRSLIKDKFVDAAPGLQFATVVMATAEILRKGPGAHAWSQDWLRETARPLIGDDADRKTFFRVFLGGDSRLFANR